SGGMVQAFINQLVLGAVRIESSWLDMQVAWKQFTDGLGDKQQIDRVQAIKIALGGLGFSLDLCATALKTATPALIKLAEAGAWVEDKLVRAAMAVERLMTALGKDGKADGRKNGEAIGDGLIEGIQGKSSGLGAVTKDLAKVVRGAFEGE